MEGEPQQRPPHISLGHRPTLCAGFLFPLAPNKKDAQRFLRRLIPYGGKESVKENRQGCLSRSIRAGGIRSVIKETLPGRPTKKDAKKASFFVGASGDTELFEKASNINGFQGGRVANNLYISPFRATVFKTAALFLYLNSSVVIRVRKPLFFPL